MGKRRADGEGTVRQRPDGMWEARTSRDEFGQRIKRVAPTQREALQRLAEAKRQAAAGITPSGADKPLSVLLPAWLEDMYRNGEIADSTYESYELTIRLHILTKPIAKLSPAKLQRRHVREWHAAIATTTRRTADYARMILGNFLNHCIEEQWLEQNVAQVVRRRRRTHAPAKHKPAPLTREQAHLLLLAVREDRLAAAYMLILTTGMRRGEALALRVDQDVDLDQGHLTIAGTLRRTNKKLKRKDTPKSRAGARSIPIAAPVVSALRAYRAQVAEERAHKLTIDDWEDTSFFFVSTRGTPVEPRNFYGTFQKLIERWNTAHADTPAAQLPKLSIHALRHAAATFLAVLGVEPRVAMEILGHSDIKTTLEIYTHVLSESKAEAMNKMSAMLATDARDIIELPTRKR